jgi:hypothetical protein
VEVPHFSLNFQTTAFYGVAAAEMDGFSGCGFLPKAATFNA